MCAVRSALNLISPGNCEVASSAAGAAAALRMPAAATCSAVSGIRPSSFSSDAFSGSAWPGQLASASISK